MTLAWAPGGTHIVGVPASPQSAGAGAQYVLGSWSGGLRSVYVFTAPASPTTYTANFVTQYYLTASATAGGSITPGSGWYDAGNSVPVSASVNSGYQFSGFTGSLTGSANPQTLAMNGPATVAANFTSAPVITTSSLMRATAGYGYYQPLSVVGGSPSYSWALAQGSGLPSWLTLTSGGALSGAPPASAAGTTVAFVVQATDSTGLVSAPQDLSLSVYFSTLSINSGPSSAVTLPGVVVPFTYSLYDIDYGADDIQWAQFYLADSAGNTNCYGDWGRPNALDLYDGNTGPTDGLGLSQSDTFCTVALVSITDSSDDPTLVTVVLNFTFNAAVSGSFSVQNQVNYASYVGPWESVGTLQINPSGGVLLTDLTQGTTSQAGQTLAAWVGDSFTLAVAGTANQAVTVAQNGNADAAIGTTDSNGNWSTGGAWQTADAGSYSQLWKVGGIPIAPNPVLIQISQFPSSYTTSGTPPPVIQPTGPPDTSAPQLVSGTAQQCGDITGNWSDASWGGTWSLVQTGNSISGQVSDGYVTWTLDSSSVIAGSTATLNAANPNGTPPPGAIQHASAIKLSASFGCNTANGSETYTFPGESPGQPYGTHLTRTTAVPAVNFSFDINGGTVQVTLTGQGKTAALTAFLNSTSGPVLFNLPNVAASTNTYSFNRLTIPPGQYNSVVVQWDDIRASAQQDVYVLGSTRFSQYNTPYENQCGGNTSVPVWVLDSVSSCHWSSLNINPAFLFQVNQNGTGVTNGNVILKSYAATSQSCNQSLPPGAVINAKARPGNTFQVVPSVAGQCSTTLYSGTSVATNPGPLDPSPKFSCSSKVLLVNSGGQTSSIKAVQDYCPACSGDFRSQLAHIDTYTSSVACDAHSIGDLPPAFAIRVK